jgi:hypothetical protein
MAEPGPQPFFDLRFGGFGELLSQVLSHDGLSRLVEVQGEPEALDGCLSFGTHDAVLDYK